MYIEKSAANQTSPVLSISSIKLDMQASVAKYLVNINLSVGVGPGLTAFKSTHQNEICQDLTYTATQSVFGRLLIERIPPCSGSRKRDTSPIDENPGVCAIYVVNRGVVCDRKFIKITILTLNSLPEYDVWEFM